MSDTKKIDDQSFERQPQASSVTVGSVIGKDYRLLEFIGQGGMGVVYKAEHRLIPGKTYAVKLLHPHAVSDSNLKRFHREALALGKLSHDGIVRIYNFGLDNDSSLYYVMEYIDGESLADYIKRQGPLNEEDCLRLFKSVASALGHAHRHGIIHRDLKPSNLMLCGSGDPLSEVKIVDFGLVRLAIDKSEERQALTATGEIFGTPFYMSPEQSIGAEVTCASDVYSLGCTIFESLTGAPPFRGENAFKTLYLHQYQEAPWLKQVAASGDFSDGLEDLVSKMLRKNPLERYQRMEQIVQDIERLQGGLPIGFGATTGYESSLRPLEPESAERDGPGWRFFSLVSVLVIGFMVSTAFVAHWLLRLPEQNKDMDIQSKSENNQTGRMIDAAEGVEPTFYINQKVLTIKPGITPAQLNMLSKQVFDGIIIDGEYSDQSWSAAFNAMRHFKNVQYIRVESMRLNRPDTMALADLPPAVEISIGNSRVDIDGLIASKIWTRTSKFDLEKVDPNQNCKNEELERATDSVLVAISKSNHLSSFCMTRMRFSEAALKKLIAASRFEELSFGRCRISPSLLMTICHTPGIKNVQIFEQYYSYQQVKNAVVGAPTLKRLELSRPVFSPEVLAVVRKNYPDFKDPSYYWSKAEISAVNKLGIAFLHKDSDYFYLPVFDDWRSRRDAMTLPLKMDTLESKDLSP